MLIRQATPEDSNEIALLFMMVMEAMVYRFIGEKDFDKGIHFFERFIQQMDNQYSYQNCVVGIEENKLVGVINSYDGAHLEKLRTPIFDYLHINFNPDLTIEDETQVGEIYIDVLSVSPLHQGKGIGSKLLRHLIDECCVKQNNTVGLLVDQKNPNAKRLYLQVGFQKVGEKLLSGHEMEHLQFKI